MKTTITEMADTIQLHIDMSDEGQPNHLYAWQRPVQGTMTDDDFTAAVEGWEKRVKKEMRDYVDRHTNQLRSGAPPMPDPSDLEAWLGRERAREVRRAMSAHGSTDA